MPEEVHVNWSKVTVQSKTTPTLQVVVNPQLERGSALHDPSFRALKSLGADYVRYVPWLPYPKQAVAELKEPTASETFWDFTYIDPTLDDFMKATAGHSVMLNFSTIPAWMYKTDKPVSYPEDPNQVFWHYTQGTELRDPTMQEAAQYFARLLSWYTQGGLTDEHGKWRASGHHYKFDYWEVLNEIDIEHNWSPQDYTKFYDTVTAAMLKVDPKIRFVGMAVSSPGRHMDMFDYFLNPANHAAGTPLEMISYHFYAGGGADADGLDQWQDGFYKQADSFLKTVQAIEVIRNKSMPQMRTDLNEIGVILPEDSKEKGNPHYVGKQPPTAYWNAAGSMYAYLFGEVAKLGIDVIGESQLIGYPSQYPSVSMMDYVTNQPNARFWILQLLKTNFSPGDAIVDASSTGSIIVDAFKTAKGRKILLINRRNESITSLLPVEARRGIASWVAPSTGDGPPAVRKLNGDRSFVLEPFEVAIVSCKAK